MINNQLEIPILFSTDLICSNLTMQIGQHDNSNLTMQIGRHDSANWPTACQEDQ